MTKKRGAQPGNANALKHGFYARFFNRAEKTALSNSVSGNLNDEIPLLRTFIARTVRSIQGQADLPLEDELASLRAITLAIGRLESMIRTQRLALGELSATDQAIQEGLRLAREDLHIPDYFNATIKYVDPPIGSSFVPKKRIVEP